MIYYCGNPPDNFTVPVGKKIICIAKFKSRVFVLSERLELVSNQSGYPVVAILLYPIYTALGGKKNLREYIKNL